MINLLPQIEKNRLAKNKRYRLILILGIIFLFFLISFSLILFLVKIHIFSLSENQKILTDIKKEEFKASDVQQVENKIKTANLNFSKLDSFYSQRDSWTGILEKISEIKPQNIYFTGLSSSLFSPSKETKEEKQYRFQMTISGYSPDRESLLEFRENLKKEKIFGEVYFPSSTLVKSSDINFNLTLKIK
ncbi:MAG: PilN domain-containing protein [Patescibacteria group bacterium]|nr:PilN domain-containing protein [Patescibacteria group bacterium]